jgi:hypothetical protein
MKHASQNSDGGKTGDRNIEHTPPDVRSCRRLWCSHLFPQSVQLRPRRNPSARALSRAETKFSKPTPVLDTQGSYPSFIGANWKDIRKEPIFNVEFEEMAV